MHALPMDLYSTTDGWVAVSHPIDDKVVFDMEFHPSDNDHVYIATDNQVINCTANISSFTYTELIGASSEIKRIALTVTPIEPDKLYISAGKETIYEGLYVSFNAGLNTVIRFNGDCNEEGNILNYAYDDCEKGQAYYNFTIAAHPVIPGYLYVGGIAMSVSYDDGESWDTTGDGWHNYGNDLHSDVHAIEIVPGTGKIVVGCGGYTLDDDEWVPRNMHLTITQFYHIDSSNDLGFVLPVMGGAQDNGTQVGFVGGESFGEITGGDGFNCHFGTYQNLSTYYTESQNGVLHRNTPELLFGIAKITPEAAYVGDNDDPNGSWDTPFEIYSKTSEKLLAGYNSVYYSFNGGESWTSVWESSDIPFGDYSGKLYFQDIVWGNEVDKVAFTVSKANSEFEVWTTNEFTNGIQTTDFEAFNWKHWDIIDITGNQGYLGISVSDVVHCPVVHNNAILVTIPGYVDSTKVFLFDSDTLWTNISYNLPNLPVLTAAADEYGIYVGTDIGIFFKYYETEEWIFFSEGLPVVPVTDIQPEEETFGRTLYIGTYGRGIWRGDAAVPNRIIRWYVNENATGNNNGSSWENAFTSFLFAEDALLQGDSIWVAGGTYYATESNNNVAARNVSFTIEKANVKVFGGFAGLVKSPSSIGATSYDHFLCMYFY